MSRFLHRGLPTLSQLQRLCWRGSRWCGSSKIISSLRGTRLLDVYVTDGLFTSTMLNRRFFCPWATNPQPSAGNTACPAQISIHAVSSGMVVWCVCFREQIETRLSNLSKVLILSRFLLSTPAAAGWVITDCCVAHQHTGRRFLESWGTTRSYFDQILGPATLPIALVHYDGLISISVALRNG